MCGVEENIKLNKDNAHLLNKLVEISHGSRNLQHPMTPPYEVDTSHRRSVSLSSAH